MWRKFEAKTDMLSGGLSLNFVVWNRVSCCPLFCVIPSVKKKIITKLLKSDVCVSVRVCMFVLVRKAVMFWDRPGL